jgi:adenylate kinase
MSFVILGAPGSGKGTQAVRIAERYTLQHISTGDLLREAVANKTPLGKQVESILTSGKLVSDEIVLELIKEAVEKLSGGNGKGWILDGFPRTMPQAEALEKVLAGISQTIDAVLVLDVDNDIIVDRLSNRRTCASCKAVYNLLNMPPKVEGKCDQCGGELVQRDDDKPDTIRKRLGVYDEQTRPIIDFYDGKYPIHRVDGTLPIDDVTAALERLVGG